MALLSPFKNNTPLTIGVELELQIVDLEHFNLTMEAEDLLRRIDEIPHSGSFKPEITQSMIEINSSAHVTYPSLRAELETLHNLLIEQARVAGVGICGGGVHPFASWKEQQFFSTERFQKLAQQYGFLAKQFTIFGQHIHIACANGNDALYLCHAMMRYIPHLIALSASSPFNQGVDTGFACTRLPIITAFPISGHPIWRLNWKKFESYFDKMARLGLVKSMKDFYWDIRPKPEFGTIEIRICDTPLTIDKAADLAAYAQMLAAWLLDQRIKLSRDMYLTYFTNRFRATRYGFDAVMIDAIQETHYPLLDDILQTGKLLEPYAAKLGTTEVLHRILETVLKRENGATWIREQYAKLGSLKEVVKAQTELWGSQKENDGN